MKLHLLQALQCVVLGTGVVSLPVGAKTLDNATAPIETVNNMVGQVFGFVSPTWEPLLLVVFILLIFAVIAHKPKAP
ncbi:MAG: hypothetical protein U9P00_00820 [Pseudomonadota bacterium]|nr:hypothetical protein [Pseudomonadota bacterium]